MDFFNALNKYIPSLVMHNWISQHDEKINITETIKKLKQQARLQ
jgi:hypothetical protein